MCLDCIKEIKFTDKKLKRGWKVVKKVVKREIGERLTGDIQPYDFTIGWNTAKNLNKSLRTLWENLPYTCGFHIWKTREAARQWKTWDQNKYIIPVYFYPSQVIVTGIQDYYDVIVTSKLFIKKADYEKVVR